MTSINHKLDHENDENSNGSSDDNETREDEERMAIRTELKSLSFEELQKLKERLGAKVYNEALFGKNEKTSQQKTFKRVNKNRPREISSKTPVSMFREVPAAKKKEIQRIDPRFDPLCGEFDKKEFNDNYNFLSEARINDIRAIKTELKQTSDPQKTIQLRRVLQRLNDQHKATRKSKVDRQKSEKQKQEFKQQYTQGKQPHFQNKSERRVESLVSQFEELKKEGTARVQRHLKRRQQKRNKHSYKAPTGVS